MKKILFAMAVLAALASCQKADLAEQNSVNTNGERVITAYFDNAQTKTTLDGVTPKWEPNDEIMLLNGSTHDKITLGESNISADGKSITFTTTLSGPLYAVYPLDATDADRIVTENIVPVTLSAEDQDGTFASANICVAKEDNGSLAFKNVTSVLYLTQAASTGVKEIIITTPSADIAGTGTVDMSAATPALELISGKSKKIKVKSASVKSEYYIAVAPTILPEGTAFGFATGSELGGTNLSEEKTIAANTIYNIGSMDADAISYHDYVEIEMTVNSVTKKYKWATMNIGASSETDAGTYFAWGDVIGQTWSGSAWSDGGFSSAPDIGDPATLPLEYDAANANWGSTWRMPTKDDFTALATECFAEWTAGYNGTSVQGLIVWKAKDGDAGWFKPSTAGKGRKIKQDGSGYNTAEDHTFSNTYTISTDVHIFFPAASCGQGNTITMIGSFGFYWSSSLFTSDPRKAYCINFNSGDVRPQYGYDPDNYGFSVRPLSD